MKKVPVLKTGTKCMVKTILAVLELLIYNGVDF